MKDQADIPKMTAMRPPSQVMRLARMGAMFPTRLSFLRVLLRQLADERSKMTRTVWAIDDEGFGHAVYSLTLGGHDYSLVAVSSALPDEARSDRVIATAWDTAYVLYDGKPDQDEIARIVATAPLQEAGRFTERDLVLSRANKSVRLFSHIVDRLRAGQQPDAALINQVGYLMRTTAVYGNGKFGIADRGLIEDRPGLSGPFAAEMLTVWMIRTFTHDLAEHLGGGALDQDLKRHLGIGNATGLGMAPFLVSHPVLLNNWMLARETALARVRAQEMREDKRTLLLGNVRRAADHLAEWAVPDPAHQSRIDKLRQEWPRIEALISNHVGAIDGLFRQGETFSLEAQELLVALLIEAFPELVDDLAAGMHDPIGLCTRPFDDAADVLQAIEALYGWALDVDFDAPEAQHQFWYVSAAKQEPRLGVRSAEPGADLESPLDIARRVQALHRALKPGMDLAAFRKAHPEHELALTRVLTNAVHPYSEIQDNLIGEDCLPIDMLRCKLAFFGATKFDPKSDRWTRITLAQGAPLPEDIEKGIGDDWWLKGLTA
ncbi:hypothetical protein [Pacificoceanicola onchidii]|uniref:hypothetical protein n=1 Tax=Pacificoceanicola onchidii TaxID=2562685 RepID=UPI0010A3237A|nr:hypothetical protein [Pacificoceanicola onchidii]